LAAAEDPDGGTGENGGGIRHEAVKMEGGQGWLKSGVRVWRGRFFRFQDPLPIRGDPAGPKGRNLAGA
jgi:hypothetical protein